MRHLLYLCAAKPIITAQHGCQRRVGQDPWVCAAEMPLRRVHILRARSYPDQGTKIGFGTVTALLDVYGAAYPGTYRQRGRMQYRKPSPRRWTRAIKSCYTRASLRQQRMILPSSCMQLLGDEVGDRRSPGAAGRLCSPTLVQEQVQNLSRQSCKGPGTRFRRRQKRVKPAPCHARMSCHVGIADSATICSIRQRI